MELKDLRGAITLSCDVLKFIKMPNAQSIVVDQLDIHFKLWTFGGYLQLLRGTERIYSQE